MRKTFGDRAFAKADPFLWNELPADIREVSTVETFLKADLKPFFLKRHFIFKYNKRLYIGIISYFITFYLNL
jgi:hypothetical protein